MCTRCRCTHCARPRSGPWFYGVTCRPRVPPQPSPRAWPARRARTQRTEPASACDPSLRVAMVADRTVVVRSTAGPSGGLLHRLRVAVHVRDDLVGALLKGERGLPRAVQLLARDLL